ncbi:MAG: pyridoxamine 5'-phosphate oxidase family protein [Phenylobacterium sp.]|uniref:pyridoxamine 5'-phosphate oxidase family protein n=1 Tax=Phenylobacterium sp. TaxID=1871053 RepID=UPI00391C7D16
MSSKPLDRATVERRLWNDLQSHQIGMLGVADQAPRHIQPMTAFAEPDQGELWFFSRNDTDLVRRIEDGSPALFVFQTKDIQACLTGDLVVRHDDARMDKYWNAVVSAWYPEGKDDPHLTMLRMRVADAEVWLREAGPVRFAWEIAKANARREMPDLGERAHLRFQ